jgi:hypothetical protein
MSVYTEHIFLNTFPFLSKFVPSSLLGPNILVSTPLSRNPQCMKCEVLTEAVNMASTGDATPQMSAPGYVTSPLTHEPNTAVHASLNIN